MSEVKDDLSAYRIFVCGLEPIAREALIQDIDENLFVEIPYDLEVLSETKADPEPLILIFGPPPPVKAPGSNIGPRSRADKAREGELRVLQDGRRPKTLRCCKASLPPVMPE